MNEKQCASYMEMNGEKVFSFLMNNIGALDSELRDDMVYRLFVKLIMGNHFTREQLIEAITANAGDQYLFASIGEEGTDSVFLRSFSALWLAGLFYADRQQPFLNAELTEPLMERCITYLAKEKDVRGYVDQKGWAHSVAHGADMMESIVLHPQCPKRFVPTILNSIESCFYKGTVYSDDEDERLVAILMAIMKQQYPEEVLMEWVEQIFERLDRRYNGKGYDKDYFNARTNILQFMKTYYFALKKQLIGHQLQNTLSYFIQKKQNI